jgi:hypothetical protein
MPSRLATRSTSRWTLSSTWTMPAMFGGGI